MATLNQSALAPYRLVQLANGAWSLHSVALGETCHPAIGPVAEAQQLYVEQLHLCERLQQHRGTFVIWDVGLGAAANALTVLRATRGTSVPMHLVSFDDTLEPLQFGLRHAATLGYFDAFESHLQALMTQKSISFQNGSQSVVWELHLTDFPGFIAQPAAQNLPKPHAILFDPFSPAKNPAMWTAPLFQNLFQLLDPARPCALPTYSRSTLLRVTLLISGFFVGRGKGIGNKEETTIAANRLELIREPLDLRWLASAGRSGSAEPMWEPVYRQTPLSASTRTRLRAHPQFNSSTGSRG